MDKADRDAAMQEHIDGIVMSNDELKLLFVKYISHVADIEGVDFTEDQYRTRYKGFEEWTDEEWSQLQKIAARK